MTPDEVSAVLAVLVGKGAYNWYLVGIGILALMVGGALTTDFHGSARTIRNRRAWLGPFAGPLWFCRLWGGMAVVSGVMLIVQ